MQPLDYQAAWTLTSRVHFWKQKIFPTISSRRLKSNKLATGACLQFAGTMATTASQSAFRSTFFQTLHLLMVMLWINALRLEQWCDNFRWTLPIDKWEETVIMPYHAQNSMGSMLMHSQEVGIWCKCFMASNFQMGAAMLSFGRMSACIIYRRLWRLAFVAWMEGIWSLQK